MRSLGRPISTARSAERRADCTIASRITARASRGFAELAFSSIMWVRSASSREPQLAPIRTALP